MKNISILGILAIASSLGFNSAASAAPITATASSTAIVAKSCSLTATDVPLVATTALINGVNFPIALTSIANPGKFTTLCNTASSGIKIKAIANHSLSGGIDPTNTYTLSATNPSAYVGKSILGNNFGMSTQKNGSINHNFSNTASELLVSARVQAAANTVLPDGDYQITITATLTP